MQLMVFCRATVGLRAVMEKSMGGTQEIEPSIYQAHDGR